MRLKRLLSIVSAVMMLGACTVFSVSADEEEESVPDFYADRSMLTTDTSAPSMSFDMTEWKNHVYITPDGSLLDLQVAQEKTYAYQGATLKITASQSKDIDDMCTYSSLIRDSDGNLVYPNSDDEDAEYLTMGVELHPGDFGLNCFDGCMITFKYRINQEAEGKLMGDSVFAFPCTDDYEKVTSTAVQLKINTTDSNNVTQYANAIISVPDKCGATKFVFEVPVIKKMEKTDVLYIDNIVISTPEQEGGVDMQVANIDGYNENAKAQEIVQGLTVAPRSNGLSSDSSSAESNSGPNVAIIIVVAVVVVGLAAVVFIFIKKRKNRFY